MKKLILILVFVFFLSSCSQENINKNNDIEGAFTQDEFALSNLEGYDIDFVYVERFFKFEDLLADQIGDFYYGKVVSIENYNFAVDKVYLEVYKSNIDCSKLINISIEKNVEWFEEGNEYIIHLNYNSEYDYYSLTDATKSIFEIKGEEILYHEYFKPYLEEENKSNISEFMKIVFD